MNQRIIGGRDATIEQIPWQIQISHMGAHRCGGSILAPNKILTAAHCLEFVLLRFLMVRAGSTFNDVGGIQIGIHRAIVHESFNIPTRYNFDIVLIFLKKSLVFGVGIQPIELPPQGFKVSAGLNANVSGWGFTELGLPRHLQVVKVPIVEHSLCVNAYLDSPVQVTSNMICAGFYGLGGRDACGGDSGGPLVIDNVLQGVVSWGIGCADPNFPGVYASTGYFRNWIDSWNL